MNHKAILALLALLALSGCGRSSLADVRSEHVVATVSDVYEDTSSMGCMGTNWNTVVRLDDQRSDRLCGKWGKVGDKIRGCWETGHSDSLVDSTVSNGFRRVCQEE